MHLSRTDLVVAIKLFPKDGAACWSLSIRRLVQGPPVDDPRSPKKRSELGDLRSHEPPSRFQDCAENLAHFHILMLIQISLQDGWLEKPNFMTIDLQLWNLGILRWSHLNRRLKHATLEMDSYPQTAFLCSTVQDNNMRTIRGNSTW